MEGVPPAPLFYTLMKKKLIAPESYWSATDEEKEAVINHCGPDGILNKFILNHLLGTKIHQSCAIHDWMFVETNSQDDLKIADDIFLKNMNIEIENGSPGLVVKFLQKLMAKVYYLAVRLYSKAQIEYK
jgi:hypothetical protein